jgi:ubiquitin-conjugating enzyme E2 W
MSDTSGGGGAAGEKVAEISGPALKRLQKEMKSFMTESPPGLSLHEDTLAGRNLSIWKVHVKGPQNTLYQGENFLLQFKFGAKYPFDSPEVTFVGPSASIPLHHHIYSNGHICLSILTDDWSPALSVQSVCLSILSMLASAKEKSRPPDDMFYVKTCSKNPKKTRWWFHDDSV